VKKFLAVSISILMGIGIVSTAKADDLNKRIGIGLGNPYISLKYGLSSKLSIEARGAFGSGISVYGARFYYNFNPKDRSVIFIGGEGDFVSFDKEDISGTGYVVYAFVGGEYFITKRFTFNLDIGPAFIGLEEDELNLSVEGIEYVFNLGINFYFK
jgi:hypothetical protein